MQYGRIKAYPGLLILYVLNNENDSGSLSVANYFHLSTIFNPASASVLLVVITGVAIKIIASL